MDAFESLVAMLLKRQGYWTDTSVKVELTSNEKRLIGRHSSPRWEIDVLAYRPKTNELLAVECKSFLDSKGVLFRGGNFSPPNRYKLFTEPTLREVVLTRLVAQLLAAGACRPGPRITLCMAVGKFASRTHIDDLRTSFAEQHWKLFEPAWILEGLRAASEAGYENDVAFVVSKLLLRHASLKVQAEPKRG